MPGGSGRFNDNSSENWPWVKPGDPNASSKRRAVPAKLKHGHRFALTLVYMRERTLRRVMRFGHCALPGSVDQAFRSRPAQSPEHRHAPQRTFTTSARPYEPRLAPACGAR
jgi:hypothetical protein